MRKTVVLTMAAGLFAASCGGGGGDDPTMAARNTCAPAADRVAIAADDLEYDTACLAVPADRDFTIVLDNQEALPHNVVILSDEDSPDSIYSGEIITGPEKVDYMVKAMGAGTYRFHCSVHPTQMKGKFLVQ
ncbi:MAG: cupredoxin domain-containing protein [Acidimicrobiales bacterium]